MLPTLLPQPLERWLYRSMPLEFPLTFYIETLIPSPEEESP